MLDIGMSELVLIGVVALIVVGPKDLPRMFHALGRMTGKARGMARDFQRAMDDAAKSTGLDDVRKDINGLRSVASPGKAGITALEQAADRFDKWDAGKAIKTATGGAAAAETTTGTVVTAAPPAAGTAAASASVGPATAALAEQKAADQAAARQKALELQAQRTTDAARKWAEKAKEQSADPAVAAVAPEVAAPSVEKPAPRRRKTKPADETAPVAEQTAEAKPKPARKPPVRAKKSDA